MGYVRQHHGINQQPKVDNFHTFYFILLKVLFFIFIFQNFRLIISFSMMSSKVDLSLYFK